MYPVNNKRFTTSQCCVIYRREEIPLKILLVIYQFLLLRILRQRKLYITKRDDISKGKKKNYERKKERNQEIKKVRATCVPDEEKLR